MVIRARSVARAVAKGDGLAELAYELARRIYDPESTASEVAACGRELRMVIAALAKSGAAQPQGDDLDKLRKQRAARRA
jgi:hypothetical protein